MTDQNYVIISMNVYFLYENQEYRHQDQRLHDYIHTHSDGKTVRVKPPADGVTDQQGWGVVNPNPPTTQLEQGFFLLLGRKKNPNKSRLSSEYCHPAQNTLAGLGVGLKE